MPIDRSRPVDLARLKLRSVRDRPHLVDIGRFAGVPSEGVSFAAWLESLPDYLGARRLRDAVHAIVQARRAGRPVVFAMGAHVVKVGCGPVIIDLIQRGVITAVACNGATAIHDVEVAMMGATSEDVAASIRDGSFGMVRETMAFFATAARQGSGRGVGLGRAIGRLILRRRFPYAHLSILAAATQLGIPATVHVAIGTDTVHMAPQADGARIGEASLTDFRRLCGVVAQLGAARPGETGGVWCNVGSAVILPEVFLKAVAVARNLGADLDAMTTVNVDMLRHYRPAQNVLTRPVAEGRGLDLAGHHEILLPLLRQAIIEAATDTPRRTPAPPGKRGSACADGAIRDGKR